MKISIFSICLFLGFISQTFAQRTTVVNRWVSPVVNDFMSFPESIYTDQQLISWGYTQKTFQFEAYSERPRESNIVAVYRWTMPNCKESILIAEHEHTDAQMLSWGYRDKIFQFYAHRYRPTDGRKFKAVYRWINAKPQGDPCRDFTLTTMFGEFSDSQLRSFGYSEKRLQFFVPAY